MSSSNPVNPKTFVSVDDDLIDEILGIDDVSWVDDLLRPDRLDDAEEYELNQLAMETEE